MTSLSISTARRSQFVEITAEVERAVRDSGTTSGVAVVYSPHTTAGITIQENADPDVVRDMLLWLERHIPKDVPGFRHAEGNSDSHLKTAFVGTSATIPIDGGKLALGRWQGVYLCEFDGPRERAVIVTVLQSA